MRKLLSSYHVAELWTDLKTKEAEENRKTLREQFDNALPLYVLMTPDGREIGRIGGRPSRAQFTAFLQKGLGAAPEKR